MSRESLMHPLKQTRRVRDQSQNYSRAINSSPFLHAKDLIVCACLREPEYAHAFQKMPHVFFCSRTNDSKNPLHSRGSMTRILALIAVLVAGICATVMNWRDAARHIVATTPMVLPAAPCHGRPGRLRSQRATVPQSLPSRRASSRLCCHPSHSRANPITNVRTPSP